jgi:methionyl-tRNA synthetase
MNAPVVIIAPPPTPNGDLHVGHLAGPYLAGDVYARYLRSCGRPVIYTTGTDDSQTYVVATARRHGTSPEELAKRCTAEIELTLQEAGIAVDGYAPFDDRYRARSLDFVSRLHAAGKFRTRRVRLPYSARTAEFLMEGLVCGDCPVCLGESRGGLCESCGHPNNFAELLAPRSAVDASDPLTEREADVLVLPMQAYRDQLTRYYAEHLPRLRPHMAQLVREVLARPLPDFPVTYPYHWGIPAPFPQTPGQVINAWVEGMPASMFCTAYAAEQLGYPPADTDELWRAEHEAKVVYFLGFDNAYFWGVTHLALLMAHEGRYVLPDAIVCNEFYELENEKFSTSKGHVVWMRDLLAHVPRDVVRFYLALTCPENQRTNFGRGALVKVAGDRLVRPWNRLVGALGDAVTRLGLHGRTLPVPPDAVARGALMLDRFTACYELDGYSLSRAADAIVAQVARLERDAQHVEDDELRVGAVYHELVTLLAGSAPILVDLADEVRELTGLPLTFPAGWAAEATGVVAFPVPQLTLAPVSVAAL